ncbi:MAG: M6 family metalloprotease domain-containing protein [Candidatus Solibacter sp.]|nr:M6 family metalloprotease domain-containing protein [Candidatus Solibacter sp.]
MNYPNRFCAAAAVALLLAGQFAIATTPPKTGKWPAWYWDYMVDGRGVTATQSLVPMMRRAQANAQAVQSGALTAEAALTAGGTAIAGTRTIPLLMVKFRNTGANPYPETNLQNELFGAFPTGTMTDYYKEISGGRLTVSGTVRPWVAISRDDTFYKGQTVTTPNGPETCNALCRTGKIQEFVTEALAANDAGINFAQFDNDGPDGIPNSGDDDGVVDFVALVHPETGGECGNNSNNIWSHRSALGPAAFTTNDPRAGGGFIKVNDYVVMPALACGAAKKMIEIGVFCHEFGHAFGLPDLYDTDDQNGKSEGVGSWCLMASGSWGGDGQSPERPTHMSAWAKQFLGWLTPTDVKSDLKAARIASLEDNPVAFKLAISPTQYYLVSYRNKILFDSKIPSPGLLVMKINETVLTAGLATNTVNANANNKGVGVVEADGRNDMDRNVNRGDSGDVFPGSTNKVAFNNKSKPKSAGKVAVCNIGQPGTTISADLITSSGTCKVSVPKAPDQKTAARCSSALWLPEGGSGGSGGSGPDLMLLLLPGAAGVFLALRGSRARGAARAV